MKVSWTPEAIRDREDIWNDLAIEAGNPRAAGRMDDLFSQAAYRLTSHPSIGRPGVVSGTREMVPHESYRLVYEVVDDTVWILAVVHTSRQWPPLRES